MALIAADTQYLVVGLGATGLSCVRYLVAKGKLVSVIDSRQAPPGLDALRAEFPDVEVTLGGFDADVMTRVDVLVMSPGVPLSTPAVQTALANGVRLSSDIELFCQAHQGRTVLITGSNAKSTVTSWLADIASRAGVTFVVGGNLGQPALTLLEEPAELAILELSSFQLELVGPLRADVATVLNVSEDHQDRYPSFAAYQQTKQRIYFGCRHAVYNRDDVLTSPLLPTGVAQTTFGLDQPDLNQFGVLEHDGEAWLACGRDLWIRAKDVALPGRHNRSNALAVMALAQAIGLDRDAILASLKAFKGLPHRCEPVGSIDGVQFVNDSKGTNVGATLAAVEGLGRDHPGRLILLLGGQGKGADFSSLSEPVAQLCKSSWVFGQDQEQIAAVLSAGGQSSTVHRVDTLEQALAGAEAEALAGDIVLLSPACASFDQFNDFQHRGDVFRSWVEARL
ncbi:UDP-N-acetylmuramoyl-L-alanine--D-glutamate ligase [Saccharospirillum alexandrii]|uniref:UDP-N-acetylmuramoyl-L-alanine--D-glutamate ligase n=1 Tax=Saccharospirillum alexandrii TaxID=2448477 RepID=UPI000FD747AB|nr:UDP-N-acetylmuramoyl-L-alanine--D-glutamate ligase [Saccharospirillum alexandrii]